MIWSYSSLPDTEREMPLQMEASWRNAHFSYKRATSSLLFELSLCLQFFKMILMPKRHVLWVMCSATLEKHPCPLVLRSNRRASWKQLVHHRVCVRLMEGGLIGKGGLESTLRKFVFSRVLLQIIKCKHILSGIYWNPRSLWLWLNLASNPSSRNHLSDSWPFP